MQLWTEYEGRKIAGTYTLGKLLRSEGRNGFFATADTTGNAAVIRLTEAHYDEDELLKRWRQVADMHEANLIGIERFGQTDFDGVAITYALMEANDANLGDVLRERPLTLAETTQVARAVHAALSALHASGLVHEHIEPSNVLAVGETVKLRSDCVRECIADIEFNTPEGCAELRRRDVHNFGMLLLECLTLEKRYNPGLNLPDVFRRMIPHMLDGTWTLEQVGQLLSPAAAAPAPSTVTAAKKSTQAATTTPQSEPASIEDREIQAGTGNSSARYAARSWRIRCRLLTALSSRGRRRVQRLPFASLDPGLPGGGHRLHHRHLALRLGEVDQARRRVKHPHNRLWLLQLQLRQCLSQSLNAVPSLVPRRSGSRGTLPAGTSSRGPTTISHRHRQRQIASTPVIAASTQRSSVLAAALRTSSASAAR